LRCGDWRLAAGWPASPLAGARRCCKWAGLGLRVLGWA
jgi:hypothetical protein